MSGPKVDYAKLREQEMASLAEARGRRLKVADKIQKMINQIDSCLGGDVDLMLQDPQIGPSCKKIQELQAQYKKELQALYNTVKHGTELLDVDAILHGGEVLLRRFGENTQEELQIINKLVATSQQYQRLQEEREILAQTKRKKIVRISNDTSRAKNVNSYERENVVRLENSVELLLENLQSCLSKIGLSQGAIESYETGSFITGKDAGALNKSIKIFGDLHEKNKEAYDEIYETEQKIKDDQKCLCICGIRNDSNRPGIHIGKSDIQKHSNNSRKRRQLNGSRCAEANHRCDRK